MGCHEKKYTPERRKRQRSAADPPDPAPQPPPVPAGASTPRKLLSYVLFPAALLLIGAAVFAFWQQIASVFFSIDDFRRWIGSKGIYGPLLFVLAQCLQVIVFVVPGEVPQVAAGYLFGFWLGSLLSIAGILLGSALSFTLARILGVPFVLALFPRNRVEMVQRLARSPRAVGVLFLAFLIPGVPKDVLCYAAGLTSIPLPLFLLVSTLARIPGIAGSALLGKAAAQQRWLLAGAVFGLSLALFLLGVVFRKPLQALLERLSSRDHRHPGR